MVYIQNEINQINMLVSRDFDNTITLGRDFASWFQLGISLLHNRVFFPTIEKKSVRKTQSKRKPRTRKPKNKDREKPTTVPRNMEIGARGRYHIPVLT